jgi:hypothetical protein
LAVNREVTKKIASGLNLQQHLYIPQLNSDQFRQVAIMSESRRDNHLIIKEEISELDSEQPTFKIEQASLKAEKLQNMVDGNIEVAQVLQQANIEPDERAVILGKASDYLIDRTVGITNSYIETEYIKIKLEQLQNETKSDKRKLVVYSDESTYKRTKKDQDDDNGKGDNTNHPASKGSLLDDFADPSQEMGDYTGGDD